MSKIDTKTTEGVVYDYKTAFLLHGFWLIAYFLLSKDIWTIMLEKWLYSGSYSHGLLVIFLSAVLIYQKKDKMACIKPQIMQKSLIALMGFGILWCASTLVQLKLGEQLAVLGFLISSVALFLGKVIFNEIKFPLFFLLLALPIGYELAPVFQWMTAQYVKIGLNLFSIPVWQEGFWFTTSTGTFEIGPSCSGFRYVIAIVGVSLLYGYWQSWSVKNSIFLILGALIMAISANGVRAACIVIWATATDTYYAIAFDHEIYGWIFFGCILVGFFLLTRLFPKKNKQSSSFKPIILIQRRYSISKLVKIETAALFFVASVLLAQVLLAKKSSDMDSLQAINLPVNSGFLGISSIDWPVSYMDSVRQISQTYCVEKKTVVAILALYGQQKANQILVQFKNKPYQPEEWNVIEDTFFKIQFETYHRIQLKRGLERKTVVTWYCIDGITTPYAWVTKILDGYQWLKKGARHAGVVVLSWDGTWAENQNAIEQFSPWLRQNIEEQFHQIQIKNITLE